MLWMIWKVGSLLWATHNKKLAALLAVPVLLLTVGAISASRVIDDGVRNQSTRIAAEEKIIREVLEAADLPVYAAEDSELYQRSIGGLADHIFTTEELGRAPRGSILVDKSVPALALTTAGAKYLQISDWSGLYSFDPAVIDALSKEGFLWQNFYSSKLFCNLKDAAILNGMNADEPLVLHGPVRLVTRNMEMDNIKGVYEVSFTLSDATPSENGKVALLEVLSEAGQKTILQEELSADCFDTDGRCRYAMIYRTISTPLVSFSVSVPEGACVTVEEITVQRVFQKITASGNVSRLIGDASDELSGWMQPRPNSINNAFYIADVILSDAHTGDSYICTAEIEFKNATAVEGKEFALFAKGATNDSGKMKEFWNAKLINLKAAPSNGVYTYTQTYTIPDAVADPPGFYIGFRYDNWASGSFRVKSLTLEKKQ